MKRCCWPILLLIPGLLRAQEALPRTFAVARDVALRVWVPSGSVRVETWDRDSIRVTGTVARNSRFFGGGNGASAKLGVDNTDPKDLTLARGALVVTVPRLAHVWIKMTDGAVVAAGTRGELEVITVAGSIDVTDGVGVVAVETIDANVALSRIDGAVRVRSGGGRVTLTQLHGTLTASTVSGNLEMSGEGLQDSRIETISGSIGVRGTVARDAIVDLDSHSGAVTLQFAPGSVPALSLSSRGGLIRNTLGKGDPSAGRIVVHTFKGTINAATATDIKGG
jgi:hypothetical protein